MEFGLQLSYCRSLSPSKAVFFYQTATSSFEPLLIEENKINGQMGNFSAAYDAKFALKKAEPRDLAYGNPQVIESCYVPPLVEEIFCRFSLRVEANSLAPLVCDSPKANRWLRQLASAYKQAGGYYELARRYAKNILNGSWLWRNQQTMGTEIIVVTSNGNRYVINDARYLDWQSNWPEPEDSTLKKLTVELANALSDPNAYWFADITAKLKMAFCQQIYPSQEFSENRGQISKQLAKVQCLDGRQGASFHAEKIGAALQTIDDWWDETPDIPLRVHEYGANKSVAVALRHPRTGRDFYQHLKYTMFYTRLMRRCCNNDGSDIPCEIHYFMSVLTKGGLFQKGKGKE